MGSATDAEQFEIGGSIGARGGEIVERVVGHLDDMVGDEFRAIARCGLRILQTALPLVNRPTGKIIGGELGENRPEIDLPVSERAVATGALQPSLSRRRRPAAPSG